MKFNITSFYSLKQGELHYMHHASDNDNNSSTCVFNAKPFGVSISNPSPLLKLLNEEQKFRRCKTHPKTQRVWWWLS